jgi:thiamine-phosphate pyrophosphorylase
MDEYISNVSPDYHKNIILHSHFELLDKYNLKGIHVSTITPPEISVSLSTCIYKSTFCYNLNDMASRDVEFDQIIIGPIFKSISNPNYYDCRYNHEVLRRFFQQNNFKNKIIAIGGIDEVSAKIAISLGFSGVVALGSIWVTYLESINIDKTINKFLRIKETCLQVCN